MRSFICCLAFLLIAQVCYADHLITNRKTSVKKGSSSESAVLIQVDEGIRLELLDNGQQQNGYYHVRSSTFTGEGWIYRTFVRRYASQPVDNPITPTAVALQGSVDIRVVDVGAGLCTLIKLPSGKFIIYDAGHWRAPTIRQITDFIPAGSTIELMVLSHTDADHIGAAAEILQTYTVRKVLWGGFERSMISTKKPTESYTELITELRNRPSVKNINLNERDSTIVPGANLQLGNVKLTFLCGFGKPLESWGLSEQSLKLNAVSIVMKLEYGTNSVLFTGDAVGRIINDPPTALIATEHYLVNNAAAYLPSKIVIAPHHGADNGSSTKFVAMVKPETVIFSAGSQTGWYHPRQAAADRYIQGGVLMPKIFRTDRADNEGAPEWSYLSVPGCHDEYGDDDVHIELRPNNTYSVYYTNASDPCDQNN